MSGLITVKDKVVAVQKLLDDRQMVIAKTLHKDFMDAARFSQICVMVCSQNPALLDCRPASLVGAVLRAASLSLNPEPALGHAWFVPFKGVVQFIPGYKGLVNLGWRTGMFEAFSATSVREGDAFDFELGDRPWLKHKPDLDSEKPFTAFYATARMIGASSAMFDLMGLKAIEAIKARSPSARTGKSPWTTDYEAMAKKTVVRRLCKLLPLNTDRAKPLTDALHMDERAELALKQRNEELLDIDPGDEDEVDEKALADGALEAERRP